MHTFGGTPEYPRIFSGDQIDSAVPPREVVDENYRRKPSDRELARQAAITLNSSFPRILQQLRSLWGTAQGEVYLDGLILDERGNRQGFPPDVLNALLILQRVHFLIYGTFRKVDPWDNIPGR